MTHSEAGRSTAGSSPFTVNREAVLGDLADCSRMHRNPAESVERPHRARLNRVVFRIDTLVWKDYRERLRSLAILRVMLSW
jgi:hypothetical protein